jgi:hypothetical protein
MIVAKEALFLTRTGLVSGWCCRVSQLASCCDTATELSEVLLLFCGILENCATHFLTRRDPPLGFCAA